MKLSLDVLEQSVEGIIAQYPRKQTDGVRYSASPIYVSHEGSKDGVVSLGDTGRAVSSGESPALLTLRNLTLWSILDNL
ncbi:MAG: hypothetical protein IAE83_00585 [Anaerolinea sp.]|nr:hypothetical protein [Anaerolinea sp.]